MRPLALLYTLLHLSRASSQPKLTSFRPRRADTGHSHLPWWALIVAILISALFLPLLSVFYAITGWQVGLTTLAQMLGAAVVPGNSQANMVRTVPSLPSSTSTSSPHCRALQYFALYSSSSVTQGINMAVDLKLAQ